MIVFRNNTISKYELQYNDMQKLPIGSTPIQIND